MSAPRFLLDSNVVIGISKGPGPARDLVDARGAPPHLSALSQISRIELLGFRSLSTIEETRLNAILSAMTVIVIDQTIEREAIALRRRTRLKLPDAIIAATARVHSLELLTLDDRLLAEYSAL